VAIKLLEEEVTLQENDIIDVIVIGGEGWVNVDNVNLQLVE